MGQKSVWYPSRYAEPWKWRAGYPVPRSALGKQVAGSAAPRSQRACSLLPGEQRRDRPCVQGSASSFARTRSDRHTSRHRSVCGRSEEHTSELQSPDHLVCRLLLEKKKTYETKPDVDPGSERDRRRSEAPAAVKALKDTSPRIQTRNRAAHEPHGPAPPRAIHHTDS